MMKKALVPALALLVASVALPAAAQSYGHGPARHNGGYEAQRHWSPIAQRKIALDRRIDRAEDRRQISRREASSLKSELNSLVRLEAQYRRGGLSQWQRQDLDRRYDRLSVRIDREIRDDNRRRH